MKEEKAIQKFVDDFRKASMIHHEALLAGIGGKQTGKQNKFISHSSKL